VNGVRFDLAGCAALMLAGVATAAYGGQAGSWWLIGLGTVMSAFSVLLAVAFTEGWRNGDELRCDREGAERRERGRPWLWR